MDTIKRYKALSIVSNVEQGELIKQLIKENKILIKKNKEREEFYSKFKDIFKKIYYRSEANIFVTDYEEGEDNDDWNFHFECMNAMDSIVKKQDEFDI
jgi:hypothetical protein|tara:strand:- start:3357 stop:3650 length:294 start_codon:yes stop_codon:yes gene_type:complete